MIRTHIVSGRGVCLSVCLFVCLSALQTSISFYLQQIQLWKCIPPLGLSTLRIQWAYSFYPQMPGSWCNRYIDIDILSVTPLLDTVTLFLQDVEQWKLILPLGYPTSGIKWCHQFWYRMLGWWDIDIMNLIFLNISFADNVRVIKVNSTPRLSYLRNQMVSSVLILDAGMLRYRYHEFDILEYLIRWQC